MAYNKTKVREQLRELMGKLYGEVEANKLSIDKFADFTESLDELWNISSDLYQPDHEGNYQSLDANHYGRLIAAYGKSLDLAKSVYAQANGVKGTDTLKEIVMNVEAVLTTDMGALENIVPGRDVTLPEVVEKGRTITLDMGNATLAGMGGQMSSRIPVEFPMPDGSVKKGFFTKKSVVAGKEELIAAADKVAEKYPQYQTFINLFKEVDDKVLLDERNWYGLDAAIKFSRGKEPQKFFTENLFTDTAKTFGLDDAMVGELVGRDDFIQFYDDLLQSLDPVLLGNKCYTNKSQWLGGKAGERIDSRNSAMSMVSKLLGKPTLIAPAENMTLLINGEKIEGTFMENAVGKEAYGLSADDPMRNYGPSTYDNPQMFDDISSIQVIDYICGNIDRHEGNFFMRFEGEGNEARLVGLTAIDNDLSFGLNIGDSSHVGNQWIKPQEMGVIGKEMALKILALDESTLKVALSGYSLSKEQIMEAWKRTNILKDKIKEGMEHYRDVPEGQLDREILRVVDEEHWRDYSIETIAKVATASQFNVFTRIPTLIKEHENRKIMEKSQREEAVRVFALKQPNPVSNVRVQRLHGEVVRDEMFVPAQPDPIKTGAVRTIDLELPVDRKAATVGGAMSQRKLVSYIDENGKEVKGFFTNRFELDRETQINKIIEELSEKYPKYEHFLQLLHKNLKEGFGITELSRKGLPGFSIGDIQMLQSDPQFMEMQNEAVTRIAGFEKLRRDYSNFLGASAESTIDLRNVAMTEISELMGLDNLLAGSRAMRIKQGDEIVEGVFMDMAVGKDYNRTSIDDAMFEYDESVYNNAPGLKSLADIQILDFVCMNMDRHLGNMMFQFEGEGTKNPRFVGVQGIDNDLSFSSKRVTMDSQVMVDDGVLDDINVISEELAEFCKHPNVTAVEQIMKNCSMGGKEMTAVIDRIALLKQRIEEGKIEVVSKEAWKEKTISQLQHGANIFSRVKKGVIDYKKTLSTSKIEQMRNSEQEGKELQFTQGNKIHISDQEIAQARDIKETAKEERQRERQSRGLSANEKMIDDRISLEDDLKHEQIENQSAVDILGEDHRNALMENLKELEASLKQADHFFGGSTEFTKMKDGFRDLVNFMDNLPDSTVKLSNTERLQLMEDYKENLQYVELVAKAMSDKVAAMSKPGSNQMDRKNAADKMITFAKTEQELVSLANRNIAARQENLLAEQRKREAIPFRNYINELFGDQELNPRNRDQRIDYEIKQGMGIVASAIESGKTVSNANAKDLIASVIIDHYIKEAQEKNKIDRVDEYLSNVGELKNRLVRNPFVEEIAGELARNPEIFAEQLMNPKHLEGIAKQFESNEIRRQRTLNAENPQRNVEQAQQGEQQVEANRNGAEQAEFFLNL